MSARLARRAFLGFGLGAGAGLLVSRVGLAAPGATNARLVFIMLRGALDGLAAVPPCGDPDYARLRGELAFGAPGTPDGALALDGFFGLNPALRFVQECYGAREALIAHAVATPYRERSHFDGQDVLEGGLARPHASQTGWLNRAAAGLPAAGGRDAPRALALGANTPLVLRGPVPVTSWSPSRLPEIDDDTLQRIVDRYAQDPLLARRLAEAMAVGRIAAEGSPPEAAATTVPARAAMAYPVVKRYLETVRMAGSFLRQPDGPAIAVLDTGGWDTHFNEGGAGGQLSQRLGALDEALRELRASLAGTWTRTVILLATEFGRTAAVNGTRGTDHGTATVALLLGGSVQGGRVRCDWPGLSARALYQGRDLAPTADLRSLIKGVLRDHLGITPRLIETQVFPDRALPYARDLIRG